MLQVIAKAEFDHIARTVKLPAQVEDDDLMGVTAALQSVERALAPATTQQRRACFLALLAVYPPRNAGAEMERARFDLYHKTLDHLPPDILWAACLECVRGVKFFPMPAEINEAAKPALSERLKTASRLRGLRDYTRVRPEAPLNLTDEERLRRRMQTEDLRRTLAADGLTEMDKREQAVAAAVVIVPDEPEISDLATAIVRARIAASKPSNVNLDFMKSMALADARQAWPFLKARGWTALKSEGVEA